MAASVNVRVCQLCFEDFDTDLKQTASPKLPVSCAYCPNTVCFQCYQNLQTCQKRNIEHYQGIRCPKCNFEKGFAGSNPVFNRALCILLNELRVPPNSPRAPVNRINVPQSRSSASPLRGQRGTTDSTRAKRAVSPIRDLVATAVQPRISNRVDQLMMGADTRSDYSDDHRSQGSRKTEIRVKSNKYKELISMPVYDEQAIAKACYWGM
jgi:hypothetical protein